MNTSDVYTPAGPAAETCTRVYTPDDAAARVSGLVLDLLLPCAPPTTAGFLALVLEGWLRQHAEELGAAALNDLASALDVEADINELRRST